MRRTTVETPGDPIARGLIALALAAAAFAILFWIASAYLDPGLRKAITFSGLGMC